MRPDHASISIIVPTLNGGKQFRHLARHLSQLQRRFDAEILIIDSESDDGTPEVAQHAGLRLHRIKRTEFGHGRTRNLGIRMTSGEVICLLSQDVLPCTPDWPRVFADTLSDPALAGAYGRQVPRDATTMEMFFVSLNYPRDPIRFEPQPGGHHPRPGRIVFSNAFSAIRRTVALQIPFHDHVPVSEDQVWAHHALIKGYALMYQPTAEALHAHRYTLPGLFRRSYLVGQALQMAGIGAGASLSEAFRFLSAELTYFMRQGHTHRVPQLLAYEMVRWMGFHLGRRRGLASR